MSYVLSGSASESANASPSSIGDKFTIEYVTNAADMVGTYSAGAKDICGNLI